jgi:hypothetical protein
MVPGGHGARIFLVVPAVSSVRHGVVRGRVRLDSVGTGIVHGSSLMLRDECYFLVLTVPLQVLPAPSLSLDDGANAVSFLNEPPVSRQVLDECCRDLYFLAHSSSKEQKTSSRIRELVRSFLDAYF